MFTLSKLIGNCIEPATFLTLLTFFALALQLTHSSCAKVFSRRMLLCMAACLFCLALLPLGMWALVPLENRYAKLSLPENVDGILMLTGDEAPGLSEARGLAVAGWASQRYIHLARLAQKYPAAKLVVVGDTRPLSPSQKTTTQDIARDILQNIGVPLERVIFEKASRNTHENAHFSKNLINPAPQETWVVVTMAPHLPRAVLCFLHEGWRVIPSASDYLTDGKITLRLFTHMSSNLDLLNLAAHEYYGLFSYWMLGWTDSLWI
ncbi:MAG: YdcF family protein [Alphaproteobacteria bacterium]|nr:YdcF family protein [Alphaproteobacteria bacterium]